MLSNTVMKLTYTSVWKQDISIEETQPSQRGLFSYVNVVLFH
jgi:hypothetical protein